MSVSRVKSTKQTARLNARIKDWDGLRATDTRNSGKVKMVNKSGFTRPGSNKK